MYGALQDTALFKQELVLGCMGHCRIQHCSNRSWCWDVWGTAGYSTVQTGVGVGMYGALQDTALFKQELVWDVWGTAGYSTVQTGVGVGMYGALQDTALFKQELVLGFMCHSCHCPCNPPPPPPPQEVTKDTALLKQELV